MSAVVAVVINCLSTLGGRHRCAAVWPVGTSSGNSYHNLHGCFGRATQARPGVALWDSQPQQSSFICLGTLACWSRQLQQFPMVIPYLYSCIHHLPKRTAQVHSIQPDGFCPQRAQGGENLPGYLRRVEKVGRVDKVVGTCWGAWGGGTRAGR